MIANYHTHTARCHHATGTEREYIEKAIAEGVRVLGFSDHVPMPFADGHQSWHRIRMEELEDYIRTLEALREEYRGHIDLLIGFEAEYYPAVFEDMLALISKYDYDYLILGQHYLGNEELEYPLGRGWDDEAFLARYVDQVCQGLSTGVFTYLAHPDNLKFVGDDAAYERQMRRLCQTCLDLDIPLEINLLGLRAGRHYPSERFFNIAADMGNKVVLGCDAHAPNEVAISENIRQGHELAKRCGLRVLDQIELRNPKK